MQAERGGGLGIRMMKEMNESLVSKLSWKMLKKKDSLWVQVMQGKYIRGQEFRQVETGQNPSWVWKSIVKNKSQLKKGACYLIGNGRDVAVWKDPWVPSIPSFKPKPQGEIEKCAVPDLGRTTQMGCRKGQAYVH